MKEIRDKLVIRGSKKLYLNRTEYKLYEAMLEWGLDPAPLLQISKMEVDFGFVNEQLIVEVDGKDHETEEQKDKDYRRDYFTWSKGWTTLRFDASEVHKDPDLYAKQVKDYIDKLPKPPFGRGEKEVPISYPIEKPIRESFGLLRTAGVVVVVGFLLLIAFSPWASFINYSNSLVEPNQPVEITAVGRTLHIENNLGRPAELKIHYRRLSSGLGIDEEVSFRKVVGEGTTYLTDKKNSNILDLGYSFSPA
ncbi:endonuclease domain-containing protein [Nanoarchaeota archaeon]